MRIFYDAYQEGRWFQDLNTRLSGAPLEPFPGSPTNSAFAAVLSLDRPDIVLTDNHMMPLLVIERTVEVPSGHNVGQRFARLVAASRARVPVVYIAPFVAYKHGGETAGPRYINLRLPAALKLMSTIEASPVTYIEWPVDATYEVRHDPATNDAVREYLELFFELLDIYGPRDMNEPLRQSAFQARRIADIATFSKTIKRSDVYSTPPSSVKIVKTIVVQAAAGRELELDLDETVLYRIGMTYIRSDPYTGGALLYSYLYCGGLDHRSRHLILWFPELTQADWEKAVALGSASKSVRLYRLAADAIQFSDGFRSRLEL